MMSTKETSALEEEERVDKQEGREERAAFVISTRDRFAASCACTLLDRRLTNGTHDMEERRRNGGMQVCEDARDS